ncbi:MAG: hypothetical protein ACRERU_08110, partial [Methylococcales bacterium]
IHPCATGYQLEAWVQDAMKRELWLWVLRPLQRSNFHARQFNHRAAASVRKDFKTTDHKEITP